jgi:hypothetical protein
MEDQLFTALIASGSALLGSVIGLLAPFLQQAHAAKHARRNKTREQYEKLAEMVARARAEVSLLRMASDPLVAHITIDLSVIQLGYQIHACCMIYFRELEPKASELANSLAESARALQRTDREVARAALAHCKGATECLSRLLKDHSHRYA